MYLIKIILFTSALGALPVALKVGPVSLSALITIIIFTLSSLSLIAKPKPKLQASSLAILLPLASFWVASVFWFLTHLISANTELQNYPVVWGGLLFVIASTSKLVVYNGARYAKIEKLFYYSSILYIVVLVYTSITREQEPATTQVGVIFFAYYLARILIRNEPKWILSIFLIFLLQALLGARIVLVAELLMLILGFYISNRSGKIKMKRSFMKAFILIFIVLVFFGVLAASNIATKTFGGDAAIDIAGVSINTSGRLYWWDVVYQNSLNTPWFGSGKAIPPEMEDVEKWAHPHNDYLRIFHQLGLFGLICWLAFIGFAIRATLRIMDNSENKSIVTLSAITVLCLFGFSILMITDNTIVYSYVVFPLAILIGLTLSFEKNIRILQTGAGAVH